MDSNTNTIASKPNGSWLLKILLLVGIVGLLAAIAVPNFVHGGSTKLHAIVNKLRQIEAAKSQFALEHGLTNASQLNKLVTAKDLAPYLLASFTEKKQFGNPGFGELYLIRDLNQPCEAVLTRQLTEKYVDSSLPEGTIIRFYQTSDGDGYELISPDGVSTISCWIHGALITTNR